MCAVDRSTTESFGLVRILLATRNKKKLVELQRLLAGSQVLTLDDVSSYPEAPETGATFAENALLKAREGARHTGMITVADDSGLSVDALNGMPGVFSARWSGEHGDDVANLNLLLGQLRDVPIERRNASFHCAAALVIPESAAVGLENENNGLIADRPFAGEFGTPWQVERVVEGEMVGTLLREPRGAGGFGYDPIFVAEGESVSNAELSPTEKDAISHRGKAFRALAKLVDQLAPIVGE
ncbi:MAG: non-canonical purine NTP pyrophosphatase [Corynebacteriales bacterium]|nr:non-canonical purine NTP pyrophosphatase [Mycobacteriales bacterium]